MVLPYNSGVTKLTNRYRSALRMLNRVVLGVCVVFGFAAFGVDTQDTGSTPVPPAGVVSIPAARQADRVAVITVEGGIDSITAMSVRRRISAAEAAGMDAMVFEIDSPGGELGAVLEISNMIKMSSITNTAAWVHPNAYSGGAIVALACNEIVTSSPASMGDAFIITVGPNGMQGLSPDQRTKLLPPLMAEVTDSARRSGYDEYLVQAIVADGIELWEIEEIGTGRRMAINEAEYRMLFDGDVVRGKPILAEVTGGIHTGVIPKAPTEQGEQDLEPTAEQDPTAYRPASETLSDVTKEFNKSERAGDLALDSATNRAVLTPGDKGRYRLVGYVTDGSAAIVMRDDQLQYFGFSTGIVQNDAELKAFFGAKELVRVRMSATEKLVRFMVNPMVRGFLIVVLLIAVFVEMIMAGTGIAGAVAIGALVLLLGPTAMVGLSGWWELIAIVLGIIALAIEAFVIPGFGVFGVVGFVLLFGGLIGTFVNAGGTMSNPETQKDLMTGSVTVLLAFVTAGIGWWLIVRNAQNLPLFDRLILSGASGVGGEPKKSMLHAIVVDDGSVKVGSEGVTTTPLYPIGQAAFGDEVVDVHSAFGTIERGVRVRVVSATRMRIEVEAIVDEGVSS
jgi:membrane-bound serine protease (ClpP class)